MPEKTYTVAMKQEVEVVRMEFHQRADDQPLLLFPGGSVHKLPSSISHDDLGTLRDWLAAWLEKAGER